MVHVERRPVPWMSAAGTGPFGQESRRNRPNPHLEPTELGASGRFVLVNQEGKKTVQVSLPRWQLGIIPVWDLGALEGRLDVDSEHRAIGPRPQLDKLNSAAAAISPRYHFGHLGHSVRQTSHANEAGRLETPSLCSLAVFSRKSRLCLILKSTT